MPPQRARPYARRSVKRLWQALEWAKNAKPLPGGRLLLIDKPDATQTYFRIGQPGIAHSDPDRTALQLVNTLFGGRFTSMLNDALRVNSGLTYGAAATLDLYREPGAITISTYTRTETTDRRWIWRFRC